MSFRIGVENLTMSSRLEVIQAFAPTSLMSIAIVMAISCTSALAFDLKSLKDDQQKIDSNVVVSEDNIADRLNKLEQAHAIEIERLERRVQELEDIIWRMQQEAKMQPVPENGLAFERQRLENWSRVSDGMERQDVYRLLGRGIKDTKTITSECRCYTLGRICFDDDGYSTKTEVRCQL